MGDSTSSGRNGAQRLGHAGIRNPNGWIALTFLPYLTQRVASSIGRERIVVLAVPLPVVFCTEHDHMEKEVQLKVQAEEEGIG